MRVEDLEKIGLSKSEAVLYLALRRLENDVAVIGRVPKREPDEIDRRYRLLCGGDPVDPYRITLELRDTGDDR